MPVVGNELYIAGSYIPSFLDTTTVLPDLDYPHQPKIVSQRQLNIPVIIITALIFIGIIAWFNVLSHWYEDTFIKDPNPDPNQSKYKNTYGSLGYAILVTIVAFVIGWILYSFSKLY